MEQTVDKVLEFVQRVGVMKPNHAKKDDFKMLAKLDKLLDDPAYVLEKKIDGCRYKIVGHRFFSSDNVEKTDNFPHLRDFFEHLNMVNLILDGEINYPGRTSQYCTHVTGPYPSGAKQFQDQNGYIHYTIFDILRTPKNNWMIRNTYQERRAMLRYFYDTFVKGTDFEPYIHLVEMVPYNKRENVNAWLDAGEEGGVLKRLDSQYHMGKKPMWQWMKIKQEDDADMVILGFEQPTVRYKGDNPATHPYWMEVDGENIPVTKPYYHGWIGSVVLGANVSGVMTRICTASGMSDEVRKDMTDNPQKYLNRVARVEYMERTTEGYPRHPRIKNMHETKRPEDCEWEFN